MTDYELSEKWYTRLDHNSQQWPQRYPQEPVGVEPSLSWHGLPIDGMTREQLLVIVKQLMRPRPIETQSRNEG